MRNKKGISLIVLVITIIVMIILAAAVIISLSNSGIINRANQAVNATNIAEVQQLASLAWSEAYLENMEDKTLTEEQRDANIKAAVEAAFAENNLNAADYKLTYGSSGVTVAMKTATKWELVRTTDANGVVTKVVVTDGTNEIEVGSTINYMPDGVGTTNYKEGWKILGADEQGRLLIVSNKGVTGSSLTLGSASNFEASRDSFAGAISELNSAVSTYRDDTIGVSVRSITVEDINNITGYDPKTYTNSFMGVSNVNVYGQKVDYSWKTGSEVVKASWKNGEETKTIEVAYPSFTYYDESTDKVITSTQSTDEYITTLEHTHYYYYGEGLISQDIAARDMLFANSYWLASRVSYLCSGTADFGIRKVTGGEIDMEFLMYSNSNYMSNAFPVRAVVTLVSNVTLTESTTAAGTYDLSI